MVEWLLRVEGVNFDKTAGDTQDLSTRRGSGLALLNAGHFVDAELRRRVGEDCVERVYAAASQALFRLRGVADGEVLAREIEAQLAFDPRFDLNQPSYDGKELPVHALTFVVAAEPIVEDPSAALERLVARNRWAQFQKPTLGPVEPLGPQAAALADPVCPIEHRRPVSKGTSVRQSMFADAATLSESNEADEKTIWVAGNVADRRSYGRHARRRFFAKEVDTTLADHVSFPDSFQDIVARPPREIPLSLRGKLAVVFADGTRFGRVREAVMAGAGDRIEGLQCFADRLGTLHHDRLLAPLLRLMVTLAHDPRRSDSVALDAAHSDSPDARKEGQPVVRFEVLVWAGEEFCWVLPAWLAWEVVGWLFAATRDWELAGHPLTHGVGVVVCNAKLPIRKAIGLAHDLCEQAKPGSEEPVANRFQLEVVESIDITDNHLETTRRRLIGAVPREAFTLDGASWSEITEHVHSLKQSFPRSQLYRLLRRAQATQALPMFAADPEVWEKGWRGVRDDLERTIDRGGYGFEGRAMRPDDLLSPLLNDDTRWPLQPLVLLSELWDVVEPLGAPVLSKAGNVP